MGCIRAVIPSKPQRVPHYDFVCGSFVPSLGESTSRLLLLVTTLEVQACR